MSMGPTICYRCRANDCDNCGKPPEGIISSHPEPCTCLHSRPLMTAPTLTSEQRRDIGEALARGERTEYGHYAILDELLPVVAVMVADAAHEAEAKEMEKWVDHIASAAQMIRETEANDRARRIAIYMPHIRRLLTEKRALAKELADLRGAVEALAGEYALFGNQQGSLYRDQCAAVARDLRALLNASSNP